MAALKFVGGNFIINTLTKGRQDDAHVARLTGGGFVATFVDYASPLSDAGSIGVVAQVFDANGVKIGDDFLVNTAKLGPQMTPAVTGLADGGFVITWFDWGPDSNLRLDVKAQVFAADGMKIGGEFTVNTAPAGTQLAPSVSALQGGGFVVAWNDYSASSIKAQVYDAASVRVGTELAVTNSSTSYDTQPAITTLANGNFVVSWLDATSSPTILQHFEAQVFRPDGTRMGEIVVTGEFPAGDLTSHDAQIVALASGGFVATWANSAGVSGQIFDSNGNKVGAPFLVETFAAADGLEDPVLTALDDGRFAIAWLADTSEFTPWGRDIVVQLLDASGMKLGSPLTANSGVYQHQWQPAITSLPGGRLLVAWTEDGTISDVGGQLLDVGEDVVITSGGGQDSAPFAVGEGQDLVTTLAAIDEDSSSITYAITGGDDALLFTIDPATGMLRFASTPDFDAPGDLDGDNVYRLTVSASSGDGDADSQAITVTVTGGNTPEAYSGTSSADVFAAPTAADWTISGLGGADTLSGNAGNDLIVGGAGKDVLTGGADADTFVFALGDSKAGGGVRDVITDFARGVDRLDLSALNITDFAEQVTFKTVGSGLIVYVDTNHDGFDYSDFGVQLTGIQSLQQSDFLL